MAETSRSQQKATEMLNRIMAETYAMKARDFALKGVDGKTYSLADVRRPKWHARRLHLQPLSLCKGIN